MSAVARGGLAALLASVLLAGASAAFEKPRVGVDCVAAAAPVKKRYLDAERIQLEAAVRDSALAVLGRSLPFVAFEPAFGGRYRAALLLAFQDTLAVNPGTSELGLHLFLYDGSQLRGTAFQTVRDKSRSAERLPARWDVLAAEVAAALRGWSSEALIERVFTHVSLADSAMCWSVPLGFVLPFTRDETCMGLGSTLRIDALIDEGAGPQPVSLGAESGNPFSPTGAIADESYRGKLFTAVRDSTRNLDVLRTDPDRLQVRSITVRRFLLYDYCGLVPPDEDQP